MTGADTEVLDRLRQRNAEYEKRFGYVYLVFANGRPAEELLAILEERIKNDPQHERRVMRMELGKINRSRLARMLGPAGRHADDMETEGDS
ncbi:allantoicase (Allantoate amidinohydrolase) [Mycobacteroides abscessus]|nr:allantoicase (Allantoate amidinohydrolase) [Mycobacteroides abscessus]